MQRASSKLNKNWKKSNGITTCSTKWSTWCGKRNAPGSCSTLWRWTLESAWWHSLSTLHCTTSCRWCGSSIWLFLCFRLGGSRDRTDSTFAIKLLRLGSSLCLMPRGRPGLWRVHMRRDSRSSITLYKTKTCKIMSLWRSKSRNLKLMQRNLALIKSEFLLRMRKRTQSSKSSKRICFSWHSAPVTTSGSLNSTFWLSQWCAYTFQLS